MVWTRKSKLDFYWKRRRKAVEYYEKAAETLGTSKKVARKKAIKAVSTEYKKRKANFAKINKLEKQIKRQQTKIEKLESKGKAVKTEQRKLETMRKNQDKLVVKTNAQWSKFESKIEYVTGGMQDEERVTKGTT